MADDKAETPSTSKRKAEWFELDDEHNTYVYISGLPTSITEEEFIDLVRKYGIIAKRTCPGNPYNVKLYRNSDGTLKGDALCQFVRVESVDLALTHLDGYPYDDTHTIHCERAKFQQKGSYDPSKKPRVDQKLKKKQKKLIEKSLSWDTKLPPEAKQKKVILKHMFSPEEITEDPSLLADIKEDVETRCSELGSEPKRVEIFDQHPDGVVAVTFADPLQAQSCIRLLDKQFYAGRTLAAELWDGKTKYKIKETHEEADKRLEAFFQQQNSQEQDEEDQAKVSESTEADQ